MSRRVKDFLRSWVIPPKVNDSYVAVKRIGTGRSPQIFFRGPLGEPGRRVNPESAVPATLYDLRVAVSGDISWVPVEKIRAETAVALNLEQHHYVRYFRDGRDSLESFYNLHQPKNLTEFFSSDGLRDDVGRLPTNVVGGELFRITPWSKVSWDFSVGGQLVGPADNIDLLQRVDRLDRVKASVEKHGMWMALASPEPNVSQLLINDESEEPDDFRVVLGEGNHRSAFLAYAGWSLIPMSHHPLRQEVRLSDLGNWPGVLDGSFNNEEARAFFFAFFRDPHDVLFPDW